MIDFINPVPFNFFDVGIHPFLRFGFLWIWVTIFFKEGTCQGLLFVPFYHNSPHCTDQMADVWILLVAKYVYSSYKFRS